MIIGMLATVIQIIVFPINTIITGLLPDFSNGILQVTSTLNSVFDSLTWALGLLPSIVIVTLSFILTCEIAKHTIWKSTQAVTTVWTVLQKIKFW
jgi:hypothetical protein